MLLRLQQPSLSFVLIRLLCMCCMEPHKAAFDMHVVLDNRLLLLSSCMSTELLQMTDLYACLVCWRTCVDSVALLVDADCGCMPIVSRDIRMM